MVEEGEAMISFTTGDILASEAEALVNTVNCVGVMGRGVALQFKNAFPANFTEYELACKKGEVRPGRMFVHERHALGGPRYIVNFPTKRHWRGNSRMDDIELGLEDLVAVIKEFRIKSIAIPPLGSGLGGLEWGQVRERIQRAVVGVAQEVDVIIYEPNSRASTKLATRAPHIPSMTAGRASLVVLMDRYLRGLLDPFVTLLELHKLMYFMQEAGEPLKLRYLKAHYGPYAQNLTHVLRAIEGYMVAGYADGGDDPRKQLSLVPGAVEEAEKFLRIHDDAKDRFDRVADLVSGFETSFGLELLSTVHWVAEHEGASNAEEAIGKVYAWNDLKRKFTSRQIELAFRTLTEKGWNSNAELA